MDTNRLKKFATEARNILKAGIAAKLTSLGFNRKGEVPENLRPQLLQGGTLWNGHTFSEGFYHQWMRLYEQVQDKGMNEVYEQAAYTWFNRLVAIRILQKNGLCEPVSTYADSARTPQIVNQARQGLFPPMEEAAKRHLLELLDDDTKVTEQFAVLLVAWCHANPILQRCFGTMEDYTELLLPANILAENGFIDLLNHTEFITDEEFRSPELIGWLYQFYISERKDEVFAKKGKFEADEIPAATQIFTPNWIVKYMVQNTVGRIYLDNNPYTTLAYKEKWQYLVEPAEPIPAEAILHYNELTDLKVADLACGSGHILNECFDLLYDLYITEGYTRVEAITHIFQDNLTGIDLDPRAQQLSLFALTLKACQRDHSFADAHCLPRVLTMPKRLNMTAEELSAACLEFVGGYEDIVAEWLEGHLELMKDADSLGSIMKFDLDADEYEFYKAKYEDWTQDGEEADDIPVAVKQLLPSVKLILTLSEKYDALVMNPPYMGGGSMNDVLSKYVKKEYELTKSDLCTVFMDLAYNLLLKNGLFAMINQSPWANKSTYNAYRLWLKDNVTIDSYLDLGSGTFAELTGEVVQSLCFSMKKSNISHKGYFYNLSTVATSEQKRFLFIETKGSPFLFSLSNIDQIPDGKICYWVLEQDINAFKHGTALGEKYPVKKGLATGNDPYFLRLWYEVSQHTIDYKCNKFDNQKNKWITICKGGGYRKWYGNINYVINWENNGAKLKNYKDENGKLLSRPQNLSYMLKEAISYNIISSRSKGFVGRYLPNYIMMTDVAPNVYDTRISAILPFLNSVVGKHFCQILCPSFKYETGYVGQIPILEYNENKVAIMGEQNIMISKIDWDSHETSWDFQQNELISLIYFTEQNLTPESLTVLCSGTASGDAVRSQCTSDVAMPQADDTPRAVRLQDLMERYHEKWSTLFMQLHANEEELNRQFIDIYGLQDELTPDVPLGEITILQQGEISIENE